MTKSKMKTISTKQVRKLQNDIKRVGGFWHEGLTDRQIWVFLSTGMPCDPIYYWKEADSFIFHGKDNPHWICITKRFWENEN